MPIYREILKFCGDFGVFGDEINSLRFRVIILIKYIYSMLYDEKNIITSS